MRIGIDFDNTLACYDELFLRLAEEAGLVQGGDRRSQKEIRELARRSKEGDLAWQRLQGLAYGPRIAEARPATGALEFLWRCSDLKISIRIISHKTEYAGHDPTRTPLRPAAIAWLESNGFLGVRTGLTAGSIRFGATRSEKIALIRKEGCTHFIDDLQETFQEPDFPRTVAGFLYAPTPVPPPRPGVKVVGSWRELAQELLHG